MPFTIFDLEHTQSVWEQKVDINLTESGVHPIRLDELLDGDTEMLASLMSCEINYPHVNGIPELRENIAALYDGASIENVLVTVGAAAADYPQRPCPRNLVRPVWLRVLCRLYTYRLWLGLTRRICSTRQTSRQSYLF